jgi:Flp pilus assembly protein TadG
MLPGRLMRGCRLNTLQDTGSAQRRRKGQSLAEFAITLPILLILTFGVIEFGRIFQAWVTLQNSARAAVRYASTGQYYDDRYELKLKFDTSNPAVTLNDATGLIPCVDDGTDSVNPPRSWSAPSVDQRGTIIDIYPNNAGDPNDKISVYDGGLESLFATWNGGKNCDPRSEADQETRKDMARLLSIFEEARKGAGGLSLEDNSWTLPPDNTSITGWPWFAVWEVPNPRESNRGWFDVVVCSTRKFDDSRNEKYYSRVDAGNVAEVNSRFVTYLGDQTLRVTKVGDPLTGTDLSADPASDPRLPQAGCLLNEVPASTLGGMLDNTGKPWLDAGGPADTVTVIVTFNHPLITPLGLAPFIKMQARRSAIVESFRSSDPQQAFGDVPALEQQPPTDTPKPTFTFTATYTASATYTKTPLPSVTPTNTQAPPFTCSLITAKPVVNGSSDGIFGNTIAIDIENKNTSATFLTRVLFRWPTILDYRDMFMEEMALNGAPHWQGMDKSDVNSATNSTDTNTDASIPANFFQNSPEVDRTIAGNDTGNWTAMLGNGPPLLQQYVSINNFSGTTFYLFNPLSPTVPCAIPLTLTPPTNTPVGNPQFTNTPTRTPDCASTQVSVRFIGFEQFGIVRLEVVNNRNVVSPMSDFTIQWRQRLPGILTLDRVTTVAPFGQPGSVEVWRSSGPTQDATPPTAGRTEGTWVQNYTFPPNSITPLLIDFGGVAGRLSDSGIGMTPSDFNGTQFRIGCGGSGGSGGGGGGSSGLIDLSNNPTPVPTSPPGPSNTPRPTYTPSKTFTPGPPTATRTPGPTLPPQPTNTPRPPPTATTPPPPPTMPGGGCIDGCG